jgi:hypothetical protein
MLDQEFYNYIKKLQAYLLEDKNNAINLTRTKVIAEASTLHYKVMVDIRKAKKEDFINFTNHFYKIKALVDHIYKNDDENIDKKIAVKLTSLYFSNEGYTYQELIEINEIIFLELSSPKSNIQNEKDFPSNVIDLVSKKLGK